MKLTRRLQKEMDSFTDKYNSIDYKKHLLKMNIPEILADVLVIQYEKIINTALHHGNIKTYNTWFSPIKKK